MPQSMPNSDRNDLLRGYADYLTSDKSDFFHNCIVLLTVTPDSTWTMP